MSQILSRERRLAIIREVRDRMVNERIEAGRHADAEKVKDTLSTIYKIVAGGSASMFSAGLTEEVR